MSNYILMVFDIVQQPERYFNMYDAPQRDPAPVDHQQPVVVSDVGCFFCVNNLF